MEDKYSLWIVPDGESGERLSEFIGNIAAAHGAPAFDPHLTLVGSILAAPENLGEVERRIAAFAHQQMPFDITLTGYGYTDEEFRCLYLLARSYFLDALYESIATYFPQVKDEHFAGMPHLSLLYGEHSEATKKGIIAAHAITPLTFTTRSFCLYKTNNPVGSWGLVRQFPLV